MEARSLEEVREMQASLEEADERLQKERERNAAMQHELLLLSQELVHAREEREKLNAHHDKQFKDQARELEKVKRKVCIATAMTTCNNHAPLTHTVNL
jgi:translation initiation factor 2B subunit (eIF-2B alpha/beta/delta family)